MLSSRIMSVMLLILYGKQVLQTLYERLIKQVSCDVELFFQTVRADIISLTLLNCLTKF